MVWPVKRFLILLACTVSLNAGSANAGPLFSELIVFGDSLVDSGNAHRGPRPPGVQDPAPAALGYFQGRFSNGYNFADYLSLAYTGAPATSFIEGGTNFAVGGARAAFSPTEVSPSFLPQLQVFGGLSRSLDDDALVLVTFGGNDVRAALADPSVVDFSATLSTFSQGLSSLISAGAQNIVVTGVPDIGALPASQVFGPAATAFATARSQLLNTQLDALVAGIGVGTGVNIDFFDLFGLEQSLRADPGAYGLAGLNTTTSCQSAGAAAVLSGCNGYLYFDAIHPTTQVHSLIAGAIGRQVSPVPEPVSWTLLLLGVGFMASRNRRMRDASGA